MNFSPASFTQHSLRDTHPTGVSQQLITRSRMLIRVHYLCESKLRQMSVTDIRTSDNVIVMI